MTARRRPKTTAEQRRRNNLHPTEYGEFTKGDQVHIKTGDRGTRWIFQYANLRSDGTLDSYTVIGGSSSGKDETKQYRAFLPDKVSPVKKAVSTTPRKNGRKVVDKSKRKA